MLICDTNEKHTIAVYVTWVSIHFFYAKLISPERCEWLHQWPQLNKEQ